MKTKTPIPIPIIVIEQVSAYIASTYPTLDEKYRVKLFTILVELWFYISVKHVDEKTRLMDKFQNASIDNIYVDISQEDLRPFTIFINGTQLQYTNLLGQLVEAKCININHSYEVGKNSKSYRPDVGIKYDLCSTVDLSLYRFYNSNKTQNDHINENPEYETLIRNLYLVKVDLGRFFTSIDDLTNKVYKTDRGRDIILIPQLAYALKIRAIKINLGIHFFKVSSTGRIYSSISNLPKLTLPYITLNGEIPVEIDAANAQPLLLASIIDQPQFKEDCESGRFYDIMAESLSMSRTDFKILSFGQIFFNNKKINKKMGTALDSIYPSLTKQINHYKSNSRKESQDWDESKFLWYKLQSLESQVFIKTALSQSRPVLTRHDSILCLPSEAPSIRTALLKEFAKLGIAATLKS